MDADKLQLHNRKAEIDDKGKDEHLSGMLNALADWTNESALTPYSGAGIGITKTTLENNFAWQFMFGVLWASTPIGGWNCGAGTLAATTGPMITMRQEQLWILMRTEAGCG